MSSVAVADQPMLDNFMEVDSSYEITQQQKVISYNEQKEAVEKYERLLNIKLSILRVESQVQQEAFEHQRRMLEMEQTRQRYLAESQQREMQRFLELQRLRLEEQRLTIPSLQQSPLFAPQSPHHLSLNDEKEHKYSLPPTPQSLSHSPNRSSLSVQIPPHSPRSPASVHSRVSHISNRPNPN